MADWSRVGSSFQDMLTRAQAGASGYYIMIPAMVILALVAVVFVVILTNAERRIPVQYAKRVVGRKMYGGQASYIPIKVNMSGVMPIIFASTLCGLPNMIGSFLNLDATKHPYWTAFFRVFNYNSVLYLVVYVLLIVAFNYFYVAIQYNPVDISNQLRKNNGTIPGIRPGKPTSDFITKTLSKITLIGAVFLAIVAAVPMIIGEIRRYLRDNSALRVSRSMRDMAYKVLQCKEALTGKNGREPTNSEIAQALGVPLGEVVSALDAITAPVSLYEPVYSDGGDPLMVMDQVRDRKNTDERWLESIALRQAIDALGAREKRILALRFYDGKTQMEVAGEVGISQAQVSRLEKNALSAIRRAIGTS